MGVAYYISLESEIDGLNTFMNGKALIHADFEEDNDPTITKIAAELNVTPLADFVCASRESILEYCDPDEPLPAWADNIPAEEWFAPNVGLATVNALLAHLASSPNRLPDQDAVIEDLQEMVRILDKAEKNQVRWHLTVDA